MHVEQPILVTFYSIIVHKMSAGVSLGRSSPVLFCHFPISGPSEQEEIPKKSFLVLYWSSLVSKRDQTPSC